MRDKIAKLLLEHWVENWEHPMYPTAVRCKHPDCDWAGRFPGDISQHNADLIMKLLSDTEAVEA